ncbi:guanine nucleotide-binding protein G(q) subunit alpha-like [Chanodichthys erythropterus]|uniref:guanine nucleotide-binding protein G(q) subunit alpha-like n=1 Tax=Chanodichthys erythropterus TaxID=933992 RepID=UPI00351E3A4E
MDYFYYCCTCCLSKEERNAITINKEINHQISELKKRKHREVKLLLLGTGQSGKTTFMKQMRIIHGKGFSEDDRRLYSKLVFQNICQAIQTMVWAMKRLNIPYSSPQNEIYAQCFQDLYTEQITQLQRSYVEAIHHLWADQGFKICYKRSREYDLSDSTK